LDIAIDSTSTRAARPRFAPPRQAIGLGLLVLAFLTFVVATTWIVLTVYRASAYQADVRTARAARAVLFRAQLDEETGMRGYTSTGDRVFLEPYTRGVSQFSSAVAELEASLTATGLDELRSTVADQRRIQAMWLRTVAQPLIAARTRSDGNARQREGKRLVDRFRGDDQMLLVALDIASTKADRAVGEILQRIVAVAIGVVVILGSVYVYILRSQIRLQAEAEEARALYDAEKGIADALTEAFIQKRLPEVANIGFSAIYLPASTEANVGGDWYDAFELPDGRVLFSIGDVAGHGVRAAVTMSRARQAIISAALHEDDPAAVLERANANLLLQDPTMVTAICGYIDPRNRQITYATAGHPAPILVSDRALYLPSEGIPLGLFATASYRSFVAEAPPNAMLALYTDGALEFDRDVIRGEERLLEGALAAAREGGANAAQTMRDRVFGNATSTDDVAIMTISFLDAGAERDWNLVERLAEGRPREIDRTLPDIRPLARIIAGSGIANIRCDAVYLRAS
jgi:serine phosphatase RsbU (regulator of sigma subunit)